MKVIDQGNGSVVIDLETPEGQATFLAAQGEDRRVWTRSPETCELSQFVNDNRKFAQISVKCGDSYKRVK